MIEFSMTELFLIGSNILLAYLLAGALTRSAAHRDNARKAEMMIQILMTNPTAREKLVESFNATFGEAK